MACCEYLWYFLFFPLFDFILLSSSWPLVLKKDVDVLKKDVEWNGPLPSRRKNNGENQTFCILFVQEFFSF